MIQVFLAQTPGSTSNQGIGCGGGLGPIADNLCKTGVDTDFVGNYLNKILGGVIGFLTIIAALWFIFVFITAGYSWITAGGDKGKLEEAQKKITNAVIGLLIVVTATIIIGVIGKILGLDILNPGDILDIIGIT